MEIATTISSPSQMPQAMLETNPADEAEASQGKAAQSPRFGLLFDQWTGMAGGKKLSVDSGSNNFSQLPLQGESSTEPAPGSAQGNDSSRGPLLRVMDAFAAGLFTMASTAPGKPFQPLPEQTAADSGVTVPKNGLNSGSGPTSGKNSIPETSTLQMFSGLWQKIGQGSNKGEIIADAFGEFSSEIALKVQIPSGNPTTLKTTRGLPIPAAEHGHSNDSPPAEKPSEVGEDGGGTDSAWTALYAVGNLLNEGNFATSLSESVGPGQQQGKVQPEENAEQSVMQTGVSQTVADGKTGTFFQCPAITLPEKTSNSLPASATSSGASILRKADIPYGTLPGIEAPPVNLERVKGRAMKTGGDAVISQAQGEAQASRSILFSRAEEINSKAVNLSPPETNVSSPEATAETLIQSRTSSDAAGNTYRTAEVEALQLGKNNALYTPGNLIQGKPPATPDSNTANTGMDLSRMEIVFAAGERENPKAPGDAVARKSSEGKTADNQSTTAFVSNPAELRALGESRIATPSPDVKNPLEEHLINQIREKLDAAGHGSDNGQITLKLHPDELGELKINMRIEDQHLKVEITTQNPSVKDALMQNLDTLKDTLSRQNISMDRFDVSADLRQGLHQGGRDGKQMTQDSRLINTGFQHTVDIEDDATPNSQYSWESENSLVNLVL